MSKVNVPVSRTSHRRPDVKEVTEADILVGYVSQIAAPMTDVCEEARGGVLFIERGLLGVPENRGPFLRLRRGQHIAEVH